MAPQRCQRTQSISAFHKHTKISEIPIPPQVVKINENALKPYSLVWEKECPLMPDTLNRMRPWSQGPMVKRPSSHWIPANQIQAAIPSPSSKNQLRNWRKLDGHKKKSERHTLPPFEIKSPLTNKQRETSSKIGSSIEEEFHHHQNSPNPTNASSTPSWWPKQMTPWDKNILNDELLQKILSWKTNVEKQGLLL